MEHKKNAPNLTPKNIQNVFMPEPLYHHAKVRYYKIYFREQKYNTLDYG